MLESCLAPKAVISGHEKSRPDEAAQDSGSWQCLWF